MKTFTIALLCVVSAIAAQSQSQKTIVDRIVAVVGDRTILSSDIMNSIEDSRRHGNDVPEGAECMLLDQAIISKVLMLQAEKDSLPVSDEEVEAELEQRIRYFINLLGSRGALEKYAGKTIYQIKDDSRQAIKERKLAEAMQQEIIRHVKITPAEVRSFFESIPKDSLPLFDSELEVGQIIIYPKATRDLEQYTVAEMNNYKRQVETRMATFEQLARLYSQHSESKIHDGHYQINRNEKIWGQDFLASAFRLKEGEISSPVKAEKFGYFLIQMLERRGDDADVCLILRVPPISETQLTQATAKLDTARSKIVAETMGFNEAALKYSEDEIQKFQGAFILNRDGSPYVTIDQLEKDIVTTIGKLKVGNISQPVSFIDEQGRKGVRLVYLKSRSEPHKMNLHDDYSKIASIVLAQKKSETFENWLRAKFHTYYITVADEIDNDCPEVKKYASREMTIN
jgi:peptidyl-prolyl cis-trans isomerase SurA